MGCQMDEIGMIEAKRRIWLKFQETSELIAAETGTFEGKTEITDWNVFSCIIGEPQDFSGYVPLALEAMCGALHAEQNLVTCNGGEERSIAKRHY